MRYLAWIAIFSLQWGMFVCGAGIDVCHASEPSYVESQKNHSSHESSTAEDTVCVAHAAHVFFWQESPEQQQSYRHAQRVDLPTILYFSEVFSLIEQPPKRLHS